VAGRRTSPAAATAWLIALTAAGRLLIARFDGLCFGEAYRFSCAIHPSLSYFDHPPRPSSGRALAWWAAAGAMLGLGMLSKYAAVLLVAGAGLHGLTARDRALVGSEKWVAKPPLT